MTAGFRTPDPINEPGYDYAPGSPERMTLERRLAEMTGQRIDIPLFIDGAEVRTGDTFPVVMPHVHGHVLADAHRAGAVDVNRAIEAALRARREWAAWPWEARAAVFLRAAELLAGEWRATLNAATMLGQSKTVHQAEIDSACELIDFFRFNVAFADRLYRDQPISARGAWNRMDYRPLDGFVYAVTPFNFTSIAGNLPTAPAIMGNTVVWKPATASLFSSYYIMKLLEAAGLPPGVINLVSGSAGEITDVVMRHRDFAGLHFTGSTAVFQSLWRKAAENLGGYSSYPRLVGETGGKDFIVAHPSADTGALRTAIIRGSFEYQGQKCSAASRIYIPETLWARMRDDLISEIEGIAMGDVTDFRNFMGAVIDRAAFDKITGYIERARTSSDAEILVGGQADDSTGYFIRPTLIRARNPKFVTMCEEIFGPVATVFVYADNAWERTLDLVDQTSPYALTGAVFATDRAAIAQADARLRFSAGNFYINDKPTGAVVGQQPFGGSRASGTNDKAGSVLNLVRWVSPRSIKETFAPPRDYRYPYMGDG
ncbi:MAG TPA: L-glutamate gamma-semialdehyde dehydrogenase [Longimicrobiales bacterium]|nr:L-glutamate gamma-semialdehyde dehydrogenase [Longimicrobiales bacterium]